MTLPVNFKGIIIESIQRVTKDVTSAKLDSAFLEEYFSPQDRPEFSYALAVGMIAGALISIYHSQYHKDMNHEEQHEMWEIISKNSDDLRDHFLVDDLK